MTARARETSVGGGYLKSSAPRDVRRIQQLCALHVGITTAELLSHRKKYRRASRARFLGYHICRTVLGMSFAEIGRAFQRDHTTIITGLRKYSPTENEKRVIAAVDQRLVPIPEEYPEPLIKRLAAFEEDLARMAREAAAIREAVVQHELRRAHLPPATDAKGAG